MFPETPRTAGFDPKQTFVIEQNCDTAQLESKTPSAIAIGAIGHPKEGAMRSDTEYLLITVKIATESRASGNHPFGALLVGPEGDVLLSSGNTYARDRGVGHAEANVARTAAQQYDPTFLERCTLVTSVEPCCMCAGACYWAGIGTVVYGLSERRLAELTRNNPQNLTLDLSCHQVFATGRRHVAIRGPFPELEVEIVNDHKDFW
jgi:tRNA(Arg) A34 adenosine deaminase TadA